MRLNKSDEFIQNSYKMQWDLKTTPHGLIDIIRGCNCRCAACYNDSLIQTKPYEKVIEDIDTMISKRNVNTLGLIGGEPLLHPDIFKIIDYIKQKGVSVELLSNGVLINETMAKKLAEAGVDFIFLHIDKGQIRADLSDNQNQEEVNSLRNEKAKLLSDCGIDVGMSITIDKNSIGTDLSQYIEYLKNSPYISTLLLTLYKNISSYGTLKGDLETEIQASYKERYKENEPSVSDILKYFYEEERAVPYWYLGGNLNPQKPHWLMYLFGVNYKKNNLFGNVLSLKYSKFEENYLKYYLKKYKRFPLYKNRNSVANFVHILINAVSGGYLFKNLLFLSKSINKKIDMKRILVQELAEVTSDGIDYCENCPDAVIKNGKLVPNCISDHFEDNCNV